jgi:hypothetical protein
MMEALENSAQVDLRKRGLLGEQEVAYQAGDMILAVNMLNEDRRVLGRTTEVLVESTSRRVLKG